MTRGWSTADTDDSESEDWVAQGETKDGARFLPAPCFLEVAEGVFATAEELGLMERNDKDYQVIRWLKWADAAAHETAQRRKKARQMPTVPAMPNPKIECQLAKCQAAAVKDEEARRLEEKTLRGRERRQERRRERRAWKEARRRIANRHEGEMLRALQRAIEKTLGNDEGLFCPIRPRHGSE